MSRKRTSRYVLNKIWERMISRCYNPSHQKYKFYGGIGVKVCAAWKKSFDSFYNWAVSNGWKDGLQIDKDINGTGKLYSPKNCRWVTRKENGRARKHLYRQMYKGKLLPVVEICESLGLNHRVVIQRMNRDGMNFKQAISRSTGTGQKHFPSKNFKK